MRYIWELSDPAGKSALSNLADILRNLIAYQTRCLHADIIGRKWQSKKKPNWENDIHS